MDKEQTMLKTTYTPGSEIESVVYLWDLYSGQNTAMAFICDKEGRRELVALKTIVELWSVLDIQENISGHRLYCANHTGIKDDTDDLLPALSCSELLSSVKLDIFAKRLGLLRMLEETDGELRSRLSKTVRCLLKLGSVTLGEIRDE